MDEKQKQESIKLMKEEIEDLKVIAEYEDLLTKIDACRLRRKMMVIENAKLMYDENVKKENNKS